MWRFLRWLLGIDDSRCRCASGTHGHAPGRCCNDATRSGGLCASCFMHAVDRFQDTHLGNNHCLIHRLIALAPSRAFQYS
jgi:hypothetical protein